MKRIKPRGYLLVVVAICVSILSLSYLKLAASAAASDDHAENQVARVAARYAAESGLVVASDKLKSRKESPPVGGWFSEELTGSRFRVSVLKAEGEKCTIASTGTAEGDASVLLSRTLEAELLLDKGGRWIVVSRRESSR